jgi:DNA helicase II / ATP-dependent DNA helicase PcrA
VLADPGKGKIGVLVARTVNLVGERGVSPERVLALTFSRWAADEIPARTTERSPEAKMVVLRKFHSFVLYSEAREAVCQGTAGEF